VAHLRTEWAAISVLSAAATVHADVAFNNLSPGDLYDANTGFLVGGPTTIVHAFQFVSGATGNINKVVLPMQYFSGVQNEFNIEVFSDSGGVPGNNLGVLGRINGVQFGMPAPPPVQLVPSGTVSLTSGATYWLIARAIGDSFGSWHVNDHGEQGLRATQSGGSQIWMTSTNTRGAFRIEVAGACYPNCDASTVAPVLNVGDFTCFLQKYAAGDPYANCDGSTVQPVLNVGDFTCFLQKYAAGCP
jgi:hypothetical protein